MWFDGQDFCNKSARYVRNVLLVHRMRPRDLGPHEESSNDLLSDRTRPINCNLQSALESRVRGRQRHASLMEEGDEEHQPGHYGNSQAAMDLGQDILEKERSHRRVVLAVAELRRE